MTPSRKRAEQALARMDAARDFEPGSAPGDEAAIEAMQSILAAERERCARVRVKVPNWAPRDQRTFKDAIAAYRERIRGMK